MKTVLNQCVTLLCIFLLTAKLTASESSSVIEDEKWNAILLLCHCNSISLNSNDLDRITSLEGLNISPR